MNRRVVEKKIFQVAKKIVKKFQPERIILFGSWAWGRPGPDSDVDLLVVKETKNTRDLARKIDGSLFPRPFPIDLIVYEPNQLEKRRRTGDFFINNILAKGRVLHG